MAGECRWYWTTSHGFCVAAVLGGPERGTMTTSRRVPTHVITALYYTRFVFTSILIDDWNTGGFVARRSRHIPGTFLLDTPPKRLAAGCLGILHRSHLIPPFHALRCTYTHHGRSIRDSSRLTASDCYSIEKLCSRRPSHRQPHNIPFLYRSSRP